MKKILALVVVLLAFGSISGANAQSASGKALVLKYGELNPDSHPMTLVAREFARLVKEKSSGQIIVDVIASSQLGDERTQMQGTQMGAIDLFRANAVSLGDFGARKSNLFSLPYLFRDREHLWKVLNGPIGKEIKDDVLTSKTGMVAIAYMEEGPRHFFFRDSPVANLAQIKGKKIRVPQTQILIDTVKAFGAAPTPISYSELYSALQTGIVDGAENPPTGYLANNFFEVAKYYTLDGHTYSPSIMIMSELAWNKLTAAQRSVIDAAARETEVFNKAIAEKADAEAFVELKKRGAQIISVSDLPKWPEAADPVYKKYAGDYLETIKKILATK